MYIYPPKVLFFQRYHYRKFRITQYMGRSWFCSRKSFLRKVFWKHNFAYVNCYILKGMCMKIQILQRIYAYICKYVNFQGHISRWIWKLLKSNSLTFKFFLLLLSAHYYGIDLWGMLFFQLILMHHLFYVPMLIAENKRYPLYHHFTLWTLFFLQNFYAKLLPRGSLL